MSTERDTHFAGFADNLWMELVQSPDWPFHAINMAHYEVVQSLKTIIAQRAYDLVGHAIDHLSSYAYDVATSDQDLWDNIPDLTEWPE